MFRAIVVLAGGLVLSCAAVSPAQNAVLNQEYGSGVHAYFACDYNDAFEHLTAAIDGGSQDPRVFYFRGLSYLRLGRPTEAAADFQKGAELESKDVNRFYNVGKALERVQGSARLEVEKYRAAARVAAYEQAERLRKARYEALQREESRVLREQMQAPEEPAKGVEPPPQPGDDNPFGPPAQGPAKKAAPVEKKPGADEGNPFDAPAKKGAPAAEKKPAAEEENPFDSPSDKPAKPEKKKEGGDKEKKPAGKAKPSEKAPAEDDPFAEQPSKEPEKKPAEKAPGEKKPAEKPAEKADPNDPFAS
ncbi:MAG: hypothetical protein LLG00_13085 [Planctomycetaceae bacterium]|nr:hypothetical protein [Planctomycetaceae bacterium]